MSCPMSCPVSYPISRRRLVAGAATAIGLATTGTGLLATASPVMREAAADSGNDTPEADKIKQAEAHYQAHPKGQQRCEICLQFMPPDHCRIVQAPISAKGWCQYFAARDNAQ